MRRRDTAVYHFPRNCPVFRGFSILRGALQQAWWSGGGPAPVRGRSHVVTYMSSFETSGVPASWGWAKEGVANHGWTPLATDEPGMAKVELS